MAFCPATPGNMLAAIRAIGSQSVAEGRVLGKAHDLSGVRAIPDIVIISGHKEIGLKTYAAHDGLLCQLSCLVTFSAFRSAKYLGCKVLYLDNKD